MAARAKDPNALEGDPYALLNPYARTKASARVRRRRSLVLVVCLVAVLLVAGGITSLTVFENLRTANISAYANDGISISGLREVDFIVTPAELESYRLVTTSATGTGMGEGGQSRAGTVNAYGPELNTFLANFGRSFEEFRSITFYCKDGYKTVLRPSRMDESQVILSVASAKEPLEPYQQPLRIVVPSLPTGNWCFGIVRIEFVLDSIEQTRPFDYEEPALESTERQRIR